VGSCGNQYGGNLNRLVRRGAIAIVAILLALGGIRLASLWSLGRIGWYGGETLEIPANPDAGFHWPYRLYIPESAAPNQPVLLWLRPNNSAANDDFAVHDQKAGHLLAVSRRGAEALSSVVLVPSFHRPLAQVDVYTHSLDRETILAPPALGRLDLQ
jgi:hypothetical protein